MASHKGVGELNNDNNGFFNTTKSLAKTPLGIIGLSLALVEVVATGVLPFTDKSLQIILVWFIVCFPVIILIAVVYLIAKHHGKLYPPSEYRNEENFPLTPGQVQFKRHDESTSFENKVNQQPVIKENDEIVEIAQFEKTNETKEKTENVTNVEGLEFAFYTAGYKGNLKEAKEHLDRISKLIMNETDKIRYEAIYLYFSYCKRQD